MIIIASFIEHFPFAIFSVAGVTAAGILVGYPASLWISEKIANYLSFFPTTKFNRPLPLIGRGEALSMNGQLVEAAELYESFLEEHPDHPDLYFHLIDLTFGPLDDPAHGYAVLNRADEHLSEQDCRALRLHREAILSGDYCPLKHLQDVRVSS